MRRRMRRGLFAAAAALLLSGVAGCASDSWSAAADVNPSEWAAGAGILFPNADSLARYDATLFLRCNDRFAEDTLTVRIAVTTPDSLRSEELFLLAIPRTPSPAALIREAAVPRTDNRNTNSAVGAVAAGRFRRHRPGRSATRLWEKTNSANSAKT